MVFGAYRVSPLKHEEYDILERALLRGTRVAISRAGRRELVLIPLKLTIDDGRERITARHPTSGHEIVIHLDEVERIEAVT